MVNPNHSFQQERASTATFIFEVDGVEIGQFMEVSGLDLDIAVEEIEEGGQNGFVHKVPGRMSWTNIVLKRGITKQDNLLTWVNKSSGEQFAVNSNKLTRSSAAITLLSITRERLRSWEFEGAFPVKWRGPRFASTSGDMAQEELEIAHHGFRAKNASPSA